MTLELPPHLGRTFTTADALAAGVTPSRLRRRDLDRPFHGVRSVRTEADDVRTLSYERELLRRVDQYSVRIGEHEFFTHVAAAVIWGLPLPPGVFRERALDVGVFAPRRNAAGSRTRGHSVKPGHAHVVEHPSMGVRVTSPASTWAMLAGELSLYDLVAVADAAIRTPVHQSEPPALTTVAQLEAAVAAGRRVGVARLREALPLVCDRSASRPETWLRLLLLDAGQPPMAVNHDVYVDGVWLARVDLAIPHLRIAIEYEGEHHLTDPAQWHRDISRADRLVDAGWRVIRVTKADVFGDPRAMIHRVRRAVASARS